LQHHLEVPAFFLSQLKGKRSSTTTIINNARHWWLTPVILATQKAEIKRTTVKVSPGKQLETLP
jgi:hypothetical protein